jgi:hypothetical protein
MSLTSFNLNANSTDIDHLIHAVEYVHTKAYCLFWAGELLKLFKKLKKLFSMCFESISFLKSNE